MNSETGIEVVKMAKCKNYKLLNEALQYHKILKEAKRVKSGFLQTETILGPIITDQPKSAIDESLTKSLRGLKVTQEEDVDMFWKLEAVGIKQNPHENEDKKALDYFQKTLYNKDRRYIVRCL